MQFTNSARLTVQKASDTFLSSAGFMGTHQAFFMSPEDPNTG